MTLSCFVKTYPLETMFVAAIAFAALLASSAIASTPEPIPTKVPAPVLGKVASAAAAAEKDGSRVMPGARLHGWGTGRVWH